MICASIERSTDSCRRARRCRRTRAHHRPVRHRRRGEHDVSRRGQRLIAGLRPQRGQQTCDRDPLYRGGNRQARPTHRRARGADNRLGRGTGLASRSSSMSATVSMRCMSFCSDVCGASTTASSHGSRYAAGAGIPALPGIRGSRADALRRATSFAAALSLAIQGSRFQHSP